ncbi:hypothetical protein BST97_12470 [Nonlabens spongiae]|uniref:Plasmid stabilization protein n=1 Tax=Nonlabens spongiae TaxID=331648 RepID=A0A1W6MMC6_9FLAO|nr:type II toxin-antitoxin system RelE/ParE family toxin [Nonlabens spongiae]ARN78741.1 hypothetical protein BST97_12470 [Nonlabens spongiae]
MENGYKILWTDHALEELAETYDYLESNFSSKELRKLSREIASTLDITSMDPEIHPTADGFENIRRVVILTYNTLYYQIEGESIIILSFFSNRQNPDKRSF